MLRTTGFIFFYLALSALALGVAWSLQVVVSIPLIKKASSGGFDAVRAIGALSTVWVVFSLLSVGPIWLAHRRAPHLRILSVAPLALGLMGFILNAVGLVTALSRADGADNIGVTLDTSVWSATGTIFLFAAILVHLVVAVRAARGKAGPAD